MRTAFLPGSGAAAAIALITATGNLSGIAAPALIGWSKDQSGGFKDGMLGLGVVLILAGVLTLSLRTFGRPKRGVVAKA